MTTPATPAPMVSAIDPHYSVNRLVIAMWEDAIRQARKGDPIARRWLYDEGVLWLDVIMDIHTDHTRRYLDRVLKSAKKANSSRTNTAQPGRGRKLERMPADPANVYA